MAFSWQLFNQTPVIGILRGVPTNTIKKFTPIYLESGFTTLEITMNSAGATESIKILRDEFGNNLNIGAGTVCSEQDLDKALDAGANFIVTPIINEKVIRFCVKEQIPIFPGAYSPTEIYNAWQMGASMIKVFPATSVGPSYIKEVKAPLNQIKLLPTGGVSIENMTEFFRAGADGVGMGSQLFPKTLVGSSDTEALGKHFQKVYKTYQQFKIDEIPEK